LFNFLTDEKQDESDELFTTLSTTTRRVSINQEAALISDTVGFISKLPAYMIEAFNSTLEELLYSDIVLVMIDASDTLYELGKKFKSCFKTLNEIGVEQHKMIFILNKSESLNENNILKIVDKLGLREDKKWIAISALTGKNIKELKKLIGEIFQNNISQKINNTGEKMHEN